MSTGAIIDQKVHVQFEQDAGPLNEIIRDPEIFDASSEDGTPGPAGIDLGALFRNPDFRFIGAYVDNQLAGFFLLKRVSAVMWEFHTAILQPFRGQCAYTAMSLMFDVVFDSLGAKKIITYVPAFNRAARMFAVHGGLQRQGVITRSFLKNGALHDQIVFGISRE